MPRVPETTSGGGVRAFTFARLEIVTCLSIICALATIAVSQQRDPFYTHGRYGKRADSYAQASPFFSGSRYGRGGASNSRGSKSESKILEVSPRVDRFFLGSRYGKRSYDKNNNNNNNPQQQQQQQQQEQQQQLLRRRISSIKRLEEALSYFDHAHRDDRFVKTIDNTYEQNSSEKINKKNGNNEEMPSEIPNEDELGKRNI